MKNFKLHNLHHAPGSVKKSLRVGRGNSARKGNKCGKGSNGNQQRSGYKRKLGFEGGQTPLNRRIPMQRHINKYRKHMHNSILLFVTYSDTLNKVLAKKIWHIIW